MALHPLDGWTWKQERFSAKCLLMAKDHWLSHGGSIWGAVLFEPKQGLCGASVSPAPFASSLVRSRARCLQHAQALPGPGSHPCTSLCWRRHRSHICQRLLSCSHLGFQMQLSWNNSVLPPTQTSLFSVLPSHSFFYGFSLSESCHMYTNEKTPKMHFNMIYQIVLLALLRSSPFFPIVNSYPTSWKYCILSLFKTCRYILLAIVSFMGTRGSLVYLACLCPESSQ